MRHPEDFPAPSRHYKRKTKAADNPAGTVITAETIVRLIRAAANHLGISSRKIAGESRCRSCHEARWAIWLVLRSHGMLCADIGEAFRTTKGNATNGVREARKDRGPAFAELCHVVADAFHVNRTTNPQIKDKDMDSR